MDSDKSGTTATDGSESSPNFVNKISNFADRHILELRLLIVGVAVTGIIIIGRSIHIARKFTALSQIPARFVDKSVRLHGRVVSVSEGGVLRVDHTPIISRRHSRGPTGLLPVRLAGVEVLPSGDQWLRDNVLHKPVWFCLLWINSDEDVVDCSVTVKQRWFRSVLVNDKLVREGLATVKHSPGVATSATYNRLTSQLIQAELFAERKGKGIWKRPSFRDKMAQFPSDVKSSTSGYLRGKYNYMKQAFTDCVAGIFKRKP